MMHVLVLGALILLAPLLLLSLLPVLVLINSVNGMQLVFMTSFRVQNRTVGPIWITPVGNFDSGRKGVLSQFATLFPAFPAFFHRDLRIAPGRSRRIIYDFDHVLSLEIVIRDAEEQLRLLVMNPDPAHSPCREPLSIEDWDCLAPVAEDTLAAAQATPKERLFWTSLLGGVVVVPLYLWLLEVYQELG